jgi:hypothetical protein
MYDKRLVLYPKRFKTSIMYSHLSNKRGVRLIDLKKKFHPPHTSPPSTFIDFLDFSPLHSTFIAFMY